MCKSLVASLGFLFLLNTSATLAQNAPVKRNVGQRSWPAEVKKVEIPTSDGVPQPSMWYAPAGGGKKPLLVGLHTWSSNFASAGGDAIYAEWCVAQGWAFVHPHFRGPNNTPDSMGSDRAVQDIVEAVAWAKKQTPIDESRIYLIGGSGGGHMSLLMAGRHPEIWAAVSAWCGITDIHAWHTFHTKDGKPAKYARDIEGALGGSPANDDALKAAAAHRSPITWLHQAKSVPVDINHGIHDGRVGSVPFTHSLHAYNSVIGDSGPKLKETDINAYYETRTLPATWKAAAASEVYGSWQPKFVQQHQNTRITIFEGGHELVHQAALNWLALQRKGQPAIWEVKKFIKLDTGGGETAK